jgi:hypothetical protein
MILVSAVVAKNTKNVTKIPLKQTNENIKVWLDELLNKIFFTLKIPVRGFFLAQS